MRLSDYKIIDIILKIWLIALIILFLVGFLVIVSGIVTGQVDTDNNIWHLRYFRLTDEGSIPET